LTRGYPSLHEFLVKELQYSDGAAHRRISAMRLVGDVPEAKESIASGALPLTTASQVQNFFHAENHLKAKGSVKVCRAEAASLAKEACRFGAADFFGDVYRKCRFCAHRFFGDDFAQRGSRFSSEACS